MAPSMRHQHSIDATGVQQMELRGVERAWRLAWMRGIARILPGPRVTTLPDVRSRPLKVLFLR